MGEVRHFHHVGLFLLALHLSTRNVWFESLPEIDRAHDSVDDCYDNQDDSNDGERRQGFANGNIALRSLGVLVHSDKLE